MWLGRPTVRGSVMNPCDHPHGGGEGRSPIGHPGPLTPWGKRVADFSFLIGTDRRLIKSIRLLQFACRFYRKTAKALAVFRLNVS